MVKNFISAVDAKQLTETSEKLLNNVFKVIKDAANYGRYTIHFDVFDVSDVVITNITSTLVAAGYRVELESDDDGKPIVLIISW